MTNYCVMVKGARKWFAADSSTGDREFMEEQVRDLRKRYPDLEFQVGTSEGTVIAPLKYRPWATELEGQGMKPLPVPKETDWSVYGECPTCLVDERRPCRSIVPRRGEEGLGHQGQPVIANPHNGRPKKDEAIVTTNVVRYNRNSNTYGPVLEFIGTKPNAKGDTLVWLRETTEGNPFPVRLPTFTNHYVAYPVPEVPEVLEPAASVKPVKLTGPQRDALIGATQAIVDVEKVGCVDGVRKALERKGYVQENSRELTPAGLKLAYELAASQ